MLLARFLQWQLAFPGAPVIAADACHDPAVVTPLPLQDASPSAAITGGRATACLLDAWTFCLPEPPVLAGDDPAWRDFFVRGLRERRGD